jgi:hypothetical protein
LAALPPNASVPISPRALALQLQVRRPAAGAIEGQGFRDRRTDVEPARARIANAPLPPRHGRRRAHAELSAR